jgi:hypothetical protein
MKKRPFVTNIIEPHIGGQYLFHQAIAQILVDEGIAAWAYKRDIEHQQNIVIRYRREPNCDGRPRQPLIYTAFVEESVGEVWFGITNGYLLATFPLADPQVFKKLVDYIRTEPGRNDSHSFRHESLCLGDMTENWVVHNDNFGSSFGGYQPKRACSWQRIAAAIRDYERHK